MRTQQNQTPSTQAKTGWGSPAIAFCMALLSASTLWAGEATPTEKPPASPAYTPIAVPSRVTAKSFTPTHAPLNLEKNDQGNNQSLTYTLVTPPSHGTITFPAAPLKKNALAHAIYTAHRDYTGPDAFTWKVGTGTAESAVVTCTLTVVPSPPVPETLCGYCVENTPLEIPATFTGGGGLSYAIKFSQPSHGTLEVNGTTFQYTPNKGFTGTDSFSWHMTYSKDPAAVPGKTPAAICGLSVKPAGLTDWPQWRADEVRSGFTTMRLPPKLLLQWKREIPRTASPFASRNAYPDIDYCRPVQLGKNLFVPETNSDSLSAYHTDTGELRWRFYASGALRRPPAALTLGDGTHLVITGSDDGWVYALNAADGILRWKFRAGPNNRKVMGFGRMSSIWPVWGSPVVHDGKVYFAAGYIPTFGTFAHCLDAATGTALWSNDGQLYDMWNTSTFGPLTFSYDHKKLYGSVEGACRPWVLDAATGAFEGHLHSGFGWPGGGKGIGPNPSRNGSCGWYADGTGAFNVPEPKTITAGTQCITPQFASDLGVKGTVASMLAGDGKLFVTTAEGSIYCYGGAQVDAPQHAYAPIPLPKVTDGWTTAVSSMLSRNDLKEGLALVLGLDQGAGAGRLVEELASQSALSIVVVDADHAKLQALRAKLDRAGWSGTRVTTLEGAPSDFAFAPCQAALITSECMDRAGMERGGDYLETLYRYTRPLGGEVWLPTTDEQDAALAGRAGASKRMPLSNISRQKAGTEPRFHFTVLKRTGLPDGMLKLKPPFGLIAFGSMNTVHAWLPLTIGWPNCDTYSWLPLKAKPVGYLSPAPPYSGDKGYPTTATVSTSESVFTSLVNPLLGKLEKFPGLPSSGNDGACSRPSNRYGDYGLTHGKLASFFDTSSNYWGRFFLPEIGGCPGRVSAGNGIVVVSASPVPGSACGCSAAMQVSDFALMPMEAEENWMVYQTVRTSDPVEEIPVRKVGINFGALGDRFEPEHGLLWTHHPYSGRYGRCSYNQAATISTLPLLPVSYTGNTRSVYRHSAIMKSSGAHARGWVAASQVTGMEEIAIALAQPVVAARFAAAPELDGALNEPAWKNARRIVFTPNHAAMDVNRSMGLPRPADECYAYWGYDDANLYVAAGTNVPFGTNAKKFLSITLNSRERVVPDLVLTCELKSKLVKSAAPPMWTYATSSTEFAPFVAEVAVPWSTLEAAGLWKEQLVVNLNLAGSLLTGQYTPLYLDAARGALAETRPHTVRLYFAEMEGKAAGQRVFDVALQGKNVLSGLDVAKEAGGPRRELVREFSGVGIADRLTIGFTARTGAPVLSGVEITGTYAAFPGKPNAPPVAVLNASEESGAAPFAITLSAQNSSDADGQIAECAWDLGDGRLARGSVVRHIFPEPGTYQIHLLVRDNHGSMAAATRKITVTPGVPAAFICTIRAQGGDFARLSDWETALKSDLTSSAVAFKVASAGTSVTADVGKTVTFAGGGTGILKSITTERAVITNLSGTANPGEVTIVGGHKLTIADSGVPLGKSLLFTVKSKGTCASSDAGTDITFSGGGKGRLRHINQSGLAYATECSGKIEPGPVVCASGRTFEISDAGHPVFLLVAECHHDWPDGLTDVLAVAPAPDGAWTTDSMHCVTIRSATGHQHKGVLKNAQGKYTGFTLKGGLDIRGVPHTRLTSCSVDPACSVSMGTGSSVTRVIAGTVNLWEGSLAANVIGTTLSAAHSTQYVSNPVSFYTINWRDGYMKPLPPNLSHVLRAQIGFYNCTAATFDPGGQADVGFVNCLAVPGGKGFHDARYADLSTAVHCASADDSACRWDSNSGNRTKQAFEFVSASTGDFHLTPKDTGASSHGGPRLGLDIDGEARMGPQHDIGADALSGNSR